MIDSIKSDDKSKKRKCIVEDLSDEDNEESSIDNTHLLQELIIGEEFKMIQEGVVETEHIFEEVFNVEQDGIFKIANNEVKPDSEDQDGNMIA